MKIKTVLITLIIIAVLAQITGAVLNSMVMSANSGMPTIACTEAIGKWVNIDNNTKFTHLADIIIVGDYVLSIGDLLIIFGVSLSMLTVWIALPQGRKFFPLLIASIAGIIISTAIPDNLISTLLCELAAIGTILFIYWKYLSSKKAKESIEM